jgi:hypothetical protein
MSLPKLGGYLDWPKAAELFSKGSGTKGKQQEGSPTDANDSNAPEGAEHGLGTTYIT